MKLRRSSWGKNMVRFSRDLRAPLVSAHALLGAARSALIKVGGKEDADTRWIDSLDNLIDRMRSMTDQMQVLAESRELSRADFTRVSVNDVLREMVDKAWPNARERRNVVTLSASSIERLPVSGNVASLRRAFASLLSNAIRYSDPCSEIILSCHHRNTFLEVSIVNQAPEGRIDNLLERVATMRSGWRLERRLQTEGLGLEIVDTVVERHGGYVTAKRRGKWTVDVIVGLPCSQTVDEGGD